jgi:hypothetical protein
MPAEHIQYAYIAGFQQRVMTLLQHDASLSRLQAEIASWQQIEEELLALPTSLDQQGDPKHARIH